MAELLLIGARLSQYVGVSIVFGTSLFFLYGVRPPSGSATTLRLGGVVLAIGALIGFVAQASAMGGSLAAGLAPEAMRFLAFDSALGRGWITRFLAGALALALVSRNLTPSRLRLIAGLGALAAASVAFMGHGAATEGAAGWAHLAADLTHALAAAAWLGALAGFLLALPRKTGGTAASDVERALRGFGGTGSVLVAILLATGIANTLFIIGLGGLSALPQSGYGRLLALKLGLFVAMVAMAAINRFRLTPGLAAGLNDPGAKGRATVALQRSISLEATAGLAVLAVVAWLGTLDPTA